MTAQVGLQSVQVVDEAEALSFPMLVMYPTIAQERPEQLGPFTLSVARDAPVLEGEHPLVLISHGRGGSPSTHRELAHHLATRGFVVGVPEHPFDNRNDQTFTNRIECLVRRPRDIALAADWFFERGPLAANVKQGSFSMIGHSIGGYTALAVAGGVPTSLPHQSADRQAKRLEVAHDPRLKALVLLAPATPWFRLPGSLSQVHAPILMIASYHDEHCPYFYMCQLVLDGVPDPARVDARLVEDAGHYSFLSPWPESMRSPALPPSMDPPGFDRRAFLDAMYADIAAFLARTAA